MSRLEEQDLGMVEVRAVAHMLGVIAPLCHAVQVRGPAYKVWTTIAAFNVKRVATGYEAQCRRDGGVCNEYRTIPTGLADG